MFLTILAIIITLWALWACRAVLLWLYRSTRVNVEEDNLLTKATVISGLLIVVYLVVRGADGWIQSTFDISTDLIRVGFYFGTILAIIFYAVVADHSKKLHNEEKLFQSAYKQITSLEERISLMDIKQKDFLNSFNIEQFNTLNITQKEKILNECGKHVKVYTEDGERRVRYKMKHFYAEIIWPEDELALAHQKERFARIKEIRTFRNWEISVEE